MLFDPTVIGSELKGIHELTHSTILACDLDVRKELFNNIILSGGTTMYKNLPERLENEVKNLAPSNIKVKVIAPPERKYSVWLGGAVLTSLASF
jgi:actin, other eukaryote